jgi:hypothetical protein
MPSVMLGEEDVVEIVDMLRQINRDLGEPVDQGIPEYLLDAMPASQNKFHYTLVISSTKDDLDLDIASIEALVYEEVGDEEARVSLTFDGVS